MGRSCSVGACESSTRKDNAVLYYTFPSSRRYRTRREKWVAACGRGADHGKPWNPGNENQSAVVCSRHFVTGKPFPEPDHPDYVPCLHLPSSGKDAAECAQRSLRRFYSNVKKEAAKQQHTEKAQQVKKRTEKRVPVASCSSEQPNGMTQGQSTSSDMTGFPPSKRQHLSCATSNFDENPTAPVPVPSCSSEQPNVMTQGQSTSSDMTGFPPSKRQHLSSGTSNFAENLITADAEISAEIDNQFILPVEQTQPVNLHLLAAAATSQRPSIQRGRLFTDSLKSSLATPTGHCSSLREGNQAAAQLPKGTIEHDAQAIPSKRSHPSGPAPTDGLHLLAEAASGQTRSEETEVLPKSGRTMPSSTDPKSRKAVVMPTGRPPVDGDKQAPAILHSGTGAPDAQTAPTKKPSYGLHHSAEPVPPNGQPHELDSEEEAEAEVEDGAHDLEEPHDDDAKDRLIAELRRQLEESESSRAKAEREKEKLEQEKKILQEQNEYLHAKLNTVRLSSALIYENDVKSKYYTGLTWGVFLALFTFLTQFTPLGGRSKMPLVDQFFLTLVRFRHADHFEKLADHAAIGKSTLIDYFWKWVNLMFMKTRFLVHWPDRDHIYSTIPPHMRVKFPKMTCIIDCFELFIDSPGNLKSRAQTYSNYKSHTTAKYLIGCNSHGAITFLSKGFGGRASDLFISQQSGFVSSNLHLPGDQILADRGFTFKDELATVCGAYLLTPQFKKGRDQFPALEVDGSRTVSSVRIHVERVIGLLKNRFGILEQTLPIRVVKSLSDEMHQAEYASLDKIVTVCAILANLESSIVYREPKASDV